MASPQIIVKIGEDGQVQVEAKCIVGAACKDLTRALEQAIGTTVGDRTKPEFYQRVNQQQGANAG